MPCPIQCFQVVENNLVDNVSTSIVNSEIYARVLFSQKYEVKFRENFWFHKVLQK